MITPIKVLLFIILFLLGNSFSLASSITTKQGEILEEIGRRIAILNSAYYCDYIRESVIYNYMDQYVESFYRTLTASQRKTATRLEIYNQFNNMSKMYLKDVEDNGVNCKVVRKMYNEIK